MTRLDGEPIESQLTHEGIAIVRGLVGNMQARARTCELSPVDRALCYLDDAALPPPLDTWRRQLYERLVPIANSWNEALGRSSRYPADWSEFLARNHAAGQRCSQSFVHRLSNSSYEALHQCHAGDHVFPFQLLLLLSQQGADFAGGELVVTERRPRMQTRPLVVPLGIGDAAIIPTAKRPVMGSHGIHATDFKHGVSRVRSGERVGLELSRTDTCNAAPLR